MKKFALFLLLALGIASGSQAQLVSKTKPISSYDDQAALGEVSGVTVWNKFGYNGCDASTSVRGRFSGKLIVD